MVCPHGSRPVRLRSGQDLAVESGHLASAARGGILWLGRGGLGGGGVDLLDESRQLGQPAESSRRPAGPSCPDSYRPLSRRPACRFSGPAGHHCRSDRRRTGCSGAVRRSSRPRSETTSCWAYGRDTHRSKAAPGRTPADRPIAVAFAERPGSRTCSTRCPVSGPCASGGPGSPPGPPRSGRGGSGAHTTARQTAPSPRGDSFTPSLAPTSFNTSRESKSRCAKSAIRYCVCRRTRLRRKYHAKQLTGCPRS